MALRVKISVRAALQIQRAAQWWLENRPEAPGAIGADMAEGRARYIGARVGTVRRLYLSRVGYFVYYRASGDSLEVLAFWRARRGSQPKL